jgi:hypothetical protein
MLTKVLHAHSACKLLEASAVPVHMAFALTTHACGLSTLPSAEGIKHLLWVHQLWLFAPSSPVRVRIIQQNTCSHGRCSQHIVLCLLQARFTVHT